MTSTADAVTSRSATGALFGPLKQVDPSGHGTTRFLSEETSRNGQQSVLAVR
jgi:hypothetical protein